MQAVQGIVSKGHEHRQMAARGRSHDTNARGIHAQRCRFCPKKTHGHFAVVDARRKACCGALTVSDAGHHEALCQNRQHARRNMTLAPRPPATAVNPEHTCPGGISTISSCCVMRVFLLAPEVELQGGAIF